MTWKLQLLDGREAMDGTLESIGYVQPVALGWAQLEAQWKIHKVIGGVSKGKYETGGLVHLLCDG